MLIMENHYLLTVVVYNDSKRNTTRQMHITAQTPREARWIALHTVFEIGCWVREFTHVELVPQNK